MLQPGLKHTKEITVTQQLTASSLGSGGLDVFATPYMITLMEATSMECVAPYLQEGQGTVGTAVDITHVAATPVGMRVTCESELTAVDGRKLVFRVTASDEAGLIGSGTHERFIIDNERFMAKTLQKLQSS